MNNICYVCGFNLLKDPEPDLNFNTKEIIPFYQCPCCGFHYSIDDNGEFEAFNLYRLNWIKDGLFFCASPHPFENYWTLEKVIEQLNNLKKIKLDDIKSIEIKHPGYVESILKLNSNWNSTFDIGMIYKYWELARK